jgi:hypothetical protein
MLRVTPHHGRVPEAGIVDRLGGLALDPGGAAQAWAQSGCQAISHARTPVPVRLVAAAEQLIAELDLRGAGLAADFAAGGLGLLAERAASLMLRRAGRTSCSGASRLMRGADGWMAVSLARADDRQLLPAWLGLDPSDRAVTTESSPWAEVERRLRSQPCGALVGSAIDLGLAVSEVGEVTDRRLVVAEPLGDRAPGAIGGLRVVNLASLWAGPLCADVLRRMGADVVCVESTGRPDGARATAHWFDAIHEGQRSVALDFGSPAGLERLRRLLESADVVIEGSRPRALEQLGIDARAIASAGRPTVWVSITGHGRGPERAMRIGLGDDAAAAGGLVAWTDAGPTFVADAVSDPMTGLLAAAAVVDQIDHGAAALLDVALSRTAAWLAARPGDPVVSRSSEAVPPRPRPVAPNRFVLGAHTDTLLRLSDPERPATD